MRLPNLLETRRGRLIAFFLLYLTEGIPSGFAVTAVATQMRRQGLDPVAIGGFIGALYLPWAIKWAFGPIVDVLSVDRWGRRRFWILLTQTAMALTLLAAMGVDTKTNFQLFSAIIILHNVFAATQDVAIDALAVNTLRTDERGLANGLMFAGQALGSALGGAGVLLVISVIGFRTSFVLVAAVILLVTVLVPLAMRESASPRRAEPKGGLGAVGAELAQFGRDTLTAFTSSRGAALALVLALLPMGAYALSLSLQSNLAVELGMDDRTIGTLGLASAIIYAPSCVAGGWLSDRFGRRRTLAVFIASMSVPTIVLAAALQRYDWIMPIDPRLGARHMAPPELLSIFWTVTLSYAVFQGLMYGVGTAIYMDVTSPKVAATQFTAYMALTNVVYSYTSVWQGHSIVRWGYPATLLVDSSVGLLCLALLPFMKPVRRAEAEPPGAALPERIGV